MLDLLLQGGVVVDGTGNPPFKADVGIRDGRIVAIGSIDEEAERVIDATGRVVAPGFIDVHTHYDAQLLWDRTASPSPLHGVTTVLGGNCGFTIAPISPDSTDYIKRMMAEVEGIPLAALETEEWSWTSFGEWLARLEGQLAVNAGFLVGHSTVRRLVMGDAAVSDEASPEQLEEMARHVGESLAAGALGFSSSLNQTHLDGDGNPVPSIASSFDEIVALSAVVGEHEGTTLEFIPTVGEISDDRMHLMADMSLAAGRPLNWNLLGSLSSAEIFQQQLTASDVAAAKGARVVALTLPDIMRMRGSTVLRAMPGWSDLLDQDEAARRAAGSSPEVRAQLRAAAQSNADRNLGVLSDWNLMEVAESRSPESERWVGMSLADIAAERNSDVIDVLIDVVLPENLPLSMVLPSLVPSLGRSDEGWEERAKVWRDPRVVLGGSDAGAHLDLMCHANYPTVVLGEAVRDRGLLSIEEAVQMMSETPARLYGLTERGRIEDGWHADLIVFDPDNVASLSAVSRYDLPGGGERLFAEAEGIDHVIVGGTPVVSNGVFSDALPGTLLRSGVDTETVGLD